MRMEHASMRFLCRSMYMASSSPVRWTFFGRSVDERPQPEIRASIGRCTHVDRPGDDDAEHAANGVQAAGLVEMKGKERWEV